VAVAVYGGAYLVEQRGGVYKKIEWNPADPYSLQGTVFFSAFSDRHHNLWIGTNYGVNYMETGNKIFDIRPVTNPGSVDYQRETTGIPFSYFEDGNDTWVSNRYKATFCFDDNNRLKKFYTCLYPLSAAKTSWRLNAYYFFRKAGDLYISTDSGLVVYDMRHDSVQLHLPNVPGLEGSFRTIIALDSERLLLRTVNDGLFVFDTRLQAFTRRFSGRDSSPGDLPRRLNYLMKTSRGDIFLSSDEGKSLVKYIPAGDRFMTVTPVNEQIYHLLSTRIFGMEEDKQGRIWLASSNGMYVYNPVSNTIESHFTENGRMELIFRVCFDDYQNVWANSNSGIWCYVRSKNRWINFNSQDGLPGSDFEGVIARRRNGDIVAGVEGALAVFHPGKLYNVSSEPPAMITEAALDDKTLLFPLLKTKDKKLSLPPGQHSFSVEFAVLNYYNVASVQYYYRLEPLMSDFRTNSNGHLNFNGLTPGHYTLHVRAENKTGDMHAQEDTMEIDVAPRWYQTWWCKALVLVFTALLCMVLVKRRIAHIRNESALRQRIVETEMQALRAQMDPHFIFNSLSSIENFIMQNEKRLASDYLNKFARLIRMILDSSRNDRVPLSRDMDALQLYIDLEQISCNNKFTYRALVDPELLNEDYLVPSLLIQPYVENAIIHGLSHSRADNLSLTVSALLESDYIRYIVEDNGIGREQARQYKLKNKPNHESLGMKITEERIHIFNRQTDGHGAVVITDLYDAAGKPAGTRVEISIKAM
ncbi:MAG: histidine kinase, partial [Bacteroidetes bacterium]|nr:histidine kinase [Bacteroidota bacterium]